MESSQGYTRRLSFGEVARQLASDSGQEIMHLLQPPSSAGFLKAAQVVYDTAQDRLNNIENIARDQCEAVGEADLRRLKRQFSSLKNTFLHYEVKQSFISGLSEGLPSGTEEVELQHVEGDVQTNVEALRGLKQQNEQVQQAMGDIVERIAEVKESLEKYQRVIGIDLERLEKDKQQHGAAVQETLVELPEGQDEDYLRNALSDMTSQTRDEEYKISANMALSKELQAAIAVDQDEMRDLQIHLSQLEEQAAAEGQKTEVDSRLQILEERCKLIVNLLTSLSGVSLLEADAESIVLQLTRAASDGNIPFQHTLTLQLQPGSQLIEHASLTPPDVDLNDIVAWISTNHQELNCVVRAVQEKLVDFIDGQKKEVNEL